MTKTETYLAAKTAWIEARTNVRQLVADGLMGTEQFRQATAQLETAVEELDNLSPQSLW